MNPSSVSRHAHFKIAVAVLAFASLPALAASNKWRIQCSEGAKSSGEVVFQFAPEGGTAFEVSVTIPDGTSENSVARLISETFKSKLDAEKFSAEVDDGEDVLVKKKGEAPNFDLKLVSNTVKAVRFHIDKE